MRLKKFWMGLSFFGALCAAVGCTPAKAEKKAEYAEGLTVSVTGGKVIGTTSEDKEVAIYKGIPYAAAPVGALRFKAPQPVQNWQGTLDCTLWGANALQGDVNVFSYWTEEFIQDTNPAHYRDGVVYSEDCLTLNIWSSYSTIKDKPVLVFIHGGGYNSGGASCEVYNGEALARQDIVFVSIQYRVGALGYLATQSLVDEEEHSGAGNYGLLDQIAALKWVRNNVEKFGGNPENVTVMGQSAGAGSVNALIASPLAEGLFASAVSASHNSVNRNWQTVEERCNQLSLSYNGKKYKDMTVEELRAIPASELKGKTLSTGGPCVDGYVLTNTYVNTVSAGKANSVSLMSGNVAEDNLISSVYTDSTKGITAVDSMLSLQNALGRLRTSAGEACPTYIYMFDYEVPGARGNADAHGAKHSYELAYFFGNFSAESGRNWTQADYELGERMMDCLVNFCLDGDPGNDWTANKGNFTYMLFASKSGNRTISIPKAEQVNAYYGFDF